MTRCRRAASLVLTPPAPVQLVPRRCRPRGTHTIALGRLPAAGRLDIVADIPEDALASTEASYRLDLDWSPDGNSWQPWAGYNWQGGGQTLPRLGLSGDFAARIGRHLRLRLTLPCRLTVGFAVVFDRSPVAPCWRPRRPALNAISIGAVSSQLTVNGAASGSVSLTPASGGSTLIVQASTFQGTSNGVDNATVSDNRNAGNYTLDLSQASPTTATASYAEVFRYSNCAGGVLTSVTVNTNAGVSGYISAMVIEVKGLDLSAPLHQTHMANGTSATPAPGSITTTEANTYVPAVMAFEGHNNTGGVGNPPTGYTARFEADNGDTTSGGASADKIRTTTGTENPSWSIISVGWSAVIAAYKAASGAVADNLGWRSRRVAYEEETEEIWVN